MSERAPDAHEARDAPDTSTDTDPAPVDPPSVDPATADPATDAPSAVADDQLVVRLHHEVVDTPAPRRALSPAQALHLASQGPTRDDATIDVDRDRDQDRPPAGRPKDHGGERTIVLPDESNERLV